MSEKQLVIDAIREQIDERAAYNDGIRAGKADRLLGRISEYARLSSATEPIYVRYYSAGYKVGQREVR